MSGFSELYRIKTVSERQEALRKFLGAQALDVPADDAIFDFGRIDPALYARGAS